MKDARISTEIWALGTFGFDEAVSHHNDLKGASISFGFVWSRSCLLTIIISSVMHCVDFWKYKSHTCIVKCIYLCMLMKFEFIFFASVCMKFSAHQCSFREAQIKLSVSFHVELQNFEICFYIDSFWCRRRLIHGGRMRCLNFTFV